MAAGDQRASVPDGLTGTGLTIGVVRARWNDGVVQRLADGVERALTDLKVTRRVDALSHMYKPKKTSYAKVEYADIAGLSGTTDQEQNVGLSGELMNAIANNDALLHVVDLSHPAWMGQIQSVMTILSQMPRKIAASNTSCDRATAVDKAMTSRLNSDRSMPSCPCVTPSHMAGTPLATWATAPFSAAARLICSG